jgi:LemA protein
VENNVAGAAGSFILTGLVVGFGIYLMLIYNGLVALKHAVTQAWRNIDVLLKQRHDELPKLVETCKQYKNFEAETLQSVINARAAAQEARTAGDVAGVGKAESTLRAGLGSIFAVAEAYPDLKADQSFQQLLDRISQIEESIADRREFYNAAVNNNNVQIEQFPDSVVAKQFEFKDADLLEFDDAELADAPMEQLFG